MQSREKRVLLGIVPILLVVLATVTATLSGGDKSSAEKTDIEEIVQNLDKWTGERVTVNGTASANIVCTQMACTSENPCCNTCGGDLFLRSDNGSLMLEFPNSTGSCSGNNCNITCQPLERGKDYKLEGAVGKSDGRATLNVTEYRTL